MKFSFLTASKIAAFLAAGAVLGVFCAAPAFAQATSTGTKAQEDDSVIPAAAEAFVQGAAEKQGLDKASFLQGVQAALQAPLGDSLPPDADEEEQVRKRNLGSADNPDSPLYKANHLADQAKRQRNQAAETNKIADDEIEQIVPPPEMESLQHVKEFHGESAASIADDPINKEIALDMRKEAQKEAALSYGARGGLAKRNFQIMESMKGFDVALDKVFDFRSLLIKTSAGLLIEPPIVKESVDALVIADGGVEAAVADKIFDINKKAKIVSAPRDWRQYLIQSWGEVPPPPRVLWPKNKEEQASWSTWVAQGWDAGFVQADQIFESNVNRLVAEYNGMVRYRMLLAQGMISAPYAMNEDRGVTGDKNQMRVGDRAIRITGPSQFLTGAELWKPADR